MAAVACGIDETSKTVQLNGFFRKTFYFYCFLKVQLYLCIYLSIYIIYLTIFQR